MALGGGVFFTQNKVLPGSYINFVSASSASPTFSDRGVAAMPISLDWGADGEVFAVTAGDFQKESLRIFGYDYTNDKVKGLRDLFQNAKMAYFYRVNSGDKAAVTEGNLTATARYSGERGNDLKVVIAVNVDDNTKFDVMTYLASTQVDMQTVSTVEELANNHFLVFSGTGELTAASGVSLSGGSSKADLEGADYQGFLDAIESYSFNTLGCLSTEETIQSLFAAFTKRMRDEQGIKFQTVIYRHPADYEGIISVENKITDENENEASLVYWVTGAGAGCAIHRSNTNKSYTGEFTVNTSYKQSDLSEGIKAGKFMFHKVGDEVKVLSDVNTLVTYTEEKGADFSSNQVIRVLDQVANDIGVLFNTRYLGKIQNNDGGRVAFWNDLVTYNKELQTVGAIEGFESKEVVVEPGSDHTSIVVTNPIMPVTAMEKLYMTVIVQ